MASKIKYLTYIEDTPKHHSLLERLAKSSISKAISESFEKSVSVTFMIGKNIVKVTPIGKKSIIKELSINRRKVKVGEKTTLSKKQEA